VGEVKGIEISGFFAWLVWRLLLTYYFPSWDRRLRLISDWVIWPIVGRDIVDIQVDREGDYDLSQNLFQAGETIVVQDEHSRYIHVIVEGEVEIVELDAATHQPLTTLGPGDHFGVRWVEARGRQAATARTAVRTIAIRRDQAPRLQEVLDSAGRLIAESGHFPAITREMEALAAREPADASLPSTPAAE
jgi:NADH dehydrogenase